MIHTIFLVEDEKSLSETLSRFLREQGYLVEVAYNGVEAAEKLPLVKPDLILLDIVLPEKSGIDFLKEIQKEGSEFDKVPVIVLTNLQGDEENFQKTGFHIASYLVKANISLEELNQRIKETLKA